MAFFVGQPALVVNENQQAHGDLILKFTTVGP
jgi:hypothetical protein